MTFQGLMEAYNEAVPKLTLSGPSHLAPVLHHAMKHVRKHSVSQDNQEYHVLMIITVSID